MDVYKIWGLISTITKEPIVCTIPTIPTTYFTQGINEITKNDILTTDFNLINEDNSNHSEDVNDATDLKEEQNVSKSKRIQRVRYLREEYHCTSCKYTCTTEKAFFRHVRKCNGNDSNDIKLSCPVCGKDVKNEELLETHMMKHRDERYFCCDICKFKTLQLKKLIQHRRMHTGEKPHLCPFCIYRSSRRDNLRSHVRRVHKKELTGDTFIPRNMIIRPSGGDINNKSDVIN